MTSGFSKEGVSVISQLEKLQRNKPDSRSKDTAATVLTDPLFSGLKKKTSRVHLKYTSKEEEKTVHVTICGAMCSQWLQLHV